MFLFDFCYKKEEESRRIDDSAFAKDPQYQMFKAVMTQDSTAVNNLIASNMKLNFNCKDEWCQMVNQSIPPQQSYRPILNLVAGFSTPEIFKTFLTACKKQYQPSKQELTSTLFCALRRKQLNESIINILISEGADVKSVDNDFTAIGLLSDNHAPRVMPTLILLINAGVKPNDQHKINILKLIQYSQILSNVKIGLLNTCLDNGITFTTESDGNLLHFISEFSTIQKDCKEALNNLVKKAINSKIDLNAQDKQGRTPLFLAVDKSYGSTEILEILLAQKDDAGEQLANPNIPALDQDTPLHKAKNYIKTVSLLVNAGADINAVDKEGNTIVHLLAHSNFLEKLMELKPSCNIANKEGVTPLMFAIEKNNTKNASLLLNNDADLLARDNKERDVADYAKSPDMRLFILSKIGIATLRPKRNSPRLAHV